MIAPQPLSDAALQQFCRTAAISTLSMQLSNGMLTNVSEQADTKIPDAITALGGLISPVGGIIKGGRMEGPPTTAPSGGQPPFWLYEIVADGNQIKLRQVQLEQIH